MAVRQTDPELAAWAEKENRRQEAFDRKCAATPRCAACGNSVYPYETFCELGGACYCKECVDAGTRFTEELEV